MRGEEGGECSQIHETMCLSRPAVIYSQGCAYPVLPDLVGGGRSLLAASVGGGIGGLLQVVNALYDIFHERQLLWQRTPSKQRRSQHDGAVPHSAQAGPVLTAG